MKKGLALLAFVLVLVSGSAQTNKEVNGTFSIGCKALNYTLKKTPAGLYSFRMDDIEKESSTVPFDNVQLDGLKVLLNKVTTPAPLTKDSASKADSLSFAPTYDSLVMVVGKYRRLIETIRADSGTILYWYNHKDSVKLLLEKPIPIRYPGISKRTGKTPPCLQHFRKS